MKNNVDKLYSDWRYRRALEFVDWRLRQGEDRAVVQLTKYLRWRDKSSSTAAPPKRFLDIAGAMKLHSLEPALAQLVEALAMARWTDQQIAHYAQLPAGVVGAYLTTFFDLRNKLHFPGRVFGHIYELQQRAETARYGLWKAIAYNFGAEELLTVVEGRPLSAKTSEWLIFITEDKIMMDAYNAAQLRTPTPENAHQLAMEDLASRRLALSREKMEQKKVVDAFNVALKKRKLVKAEEMQELREKRIAQTAAKKEERKIAKERLQFIKFLCGSKGAGMLCALRDMTQKERTSTEETNPLTELRWKPPVAEESQPLEEHREPSAVEDVHHKEVFIGSDVHDCDGEREREEELVGAAA